MPKKLLLSDCAAIRSASPLVLNITNYVAMNLSANALLAVGASPIMSSFADELPELILSASSLCINIGCLDNPQILAMNVAADKAHSLSLPWILDPAAPAHPLSVLILASILSALSIPPSSAVMPPKSSLSTMHSLHVMTRAITMGWTLWLALTMWHPKPRPSLVSLALWSLSAGLLTS